METQAAEGAQYLSVTEVMVDVAVVRKMIPLLGPKSLPEASSLFDCRSHYVPDFRRLTG